MIATAGWLPVYAAGGGRCDEGTTSHTSNGPKSPDAPAAGVMPVDSKTLAEHPDKFYGATVDVPAPVAHVYSPRIFGLSDQGADNKAQHDILVIAPREVNLKEGQKVVVRGKVRHYDREELQRDFPWFHITSEAEDRDRHRPVIVAEAIRTPQGSELMPATAGDAPMHQSR